MSKKMFSKEIKLWQDDDGDHDIDLVAVVDVCVGDYVVVALDVEANFNLALCFL